MRYLKLFAMITIFTVIASAYAFSQDSAKPVDQQKTPPEAPAAVAQPKEIDIYGEVQAVNVSSNTVSVQYYDYDSDSEKTSEIAASSDTKLGNVKELGDMKKGDWVDVTYIVSGGKNVAKTISVEKEEPAEEVPGVRAQ